MGKRLNRYKGSVIANVLPDLVEKEISIVLQNGSTYHGILLQSSGNKFSFKDFRDVTHVFKIEEIMEIITDEITTF
jgi:hypothetical protein